MSHAPAYRVCGTCGSTWTAPLIRRSSCPYSHAHPHDATSRPVSRRDTTLLHGERERDA